MPQSTTRLQLAVALVPCLLMTAPLVRAQIDRSLAPPHMVSRGELDCSAGKTCHGLTGAVYVVIQVLVDGSVGDVTVKSSSDPRLNDAAIDAAKRYTFQPGIRNGKPAVMTYDVHFRFNEPGVVGYPITCSGLGNRTSSLTSFSAAACFLVGRGIIATHPGS